MKLLVVLLVSWFSLAANCYADVDFDEFHKRSMDLINEIYADLTAGDPGESEEMPTLPYAWDRQLHDIEDRLATERPKSPNNHRLEEISEGLKRIRDLNVENTAYNEGQKVEDAARPAEREEPQRDNRLADWLKGSSEPDTAATVAFLTVHYRNYLAAKICGEANVGFSDKEVSAYATALKTKAENIGLEKSQRDVAWNTAQQQVAAFRPMMREGTCIGTRREILSWFPGVFAVANTENPF